MRQIVHVIKPTGGRFELTFSETISDNKILAELESIKEMFGYNKIVSRMDTDSPVPALADFSDKESGYAYDHPDCAVVVLKTDNLGEPVFEKGIPVVAKQLKG
jgi:hypothetical protein